MTAKPWFRWYRGTCSDTKLRLIGLQYDVPTAAVVGAWAAVLECVTEDNGAVTLGSVTVTHDALRLYLKASLDMDDDTARDVVDGLFWQTLLVEDKGAFKVQNWQKRQYLDHTNAERQKRFRDKQKSNGTSNGAVTHRQRTESETESDKKIPPAIAGGSTRGVCVCPTDFQPNASTLDALGREGFSASDIRSAVAEMVDWSRGGGKRKKDWDATLRNWVRRNNRPAAKTRTRSAMERNLERNSQ